MNDEVDESKSNTAPQVSDSSSENEEIQAKDGNQTTEPLSEELAPEISEENQEQANFSEEDSSSGAEPEESVKSDDSNEEQSGKESDDDLTKLDDSDLKRPKHRTPLVKPISRLWRTWLELIQILTRPRKTSTHYSRSKLTR